MRLIDADELMEDLTYVIETMIEEYEDDDFGVHNEHDVKYLKGNIDFSEIAKRLIEKQRTAYDLDKVVKQLDKESELIRPVGWAYPQEVILTRSVLEIVKAGGIDE